MDIDEMIAEVERLDREATPGPWDADHSWWPGEDEDEYAAVGPVHKLRKYDFLDLDTPEKRAGLDVAMMGIRADESLIAHYRTAAPLLAAEVKRLRAGGCARDQRTTQFCAEAVAKDAEIAKLRDQILGYQQELHVAEQEIARLKRTMIEPTEQTGDEDSEHGAPVCVLCGRDIDVSAPFPTGPASGPAGRILGDDESAHGECLDHARQAVA